MTGRDAVDDRPGTGHNATVLLGHLAAHLAAALPPRHPGQVCVAGLHTGTQHNRVYGAGDLLVNLSYPTPACGRRLEEALATEVRAGLVDFADRFVAVPDLALTAVDAAAITRVDWLKRGLPTLAGADPALETLLDRAGLHRWPDKEPAFSCDAIWLDAVPGAFTVVLGPGDLAANHAHDDAEYADVADLEAFAGAVDRILRAFAGTR